MKIRSAVPEKGSHIYALSWWTEKKQKNAVKHIRIRAPWRRRMRKLECMAKISMMAVGWVDQNYFSKFGDQSSPN